MERGGQEGLTKEDARARSLSLLARVLAQLQYLSWGERGRGIKRGEAWVECRKDTSEKGQTKPYLRDRQLALVHNVCPFWLGEVAAWLCVRRG